LIPGTDKPYSGFHPFGVGKMRSSICSWVLTTTEVCGVKRAAVRWSRGVMQQEAKTIPHAHGSLAVSAGALEIAIVIQGALEVLSLNLFYLVRTLNLHN